MSDEILKDAYVALISKYATVRRQLMKFGTHVPPCEGTGSQPCPCGWDDCIAKLAEDEKDAEH